MSHKISISVPQSPAFSYSIFMQAGLLQQISAHIPKNVNCIVIITDQTVKKYYGSALLQHLQQQGYKALLFAFAAGEQAKNMQTKGKLENNMLRHHCGRDTLLVALGGGVVGDLAGFIAATYMRGIPYLQVPTTLLAMVDSSVGGKTAINTPHGKNLIGAFWQPLAVIVDVNCLNSLPKKQLINGLIEAVKMFLTHDITSLQYLQKNLASLLNYDLKILTQIIKRAVKIKATIVKQDVREKNRRAALNFGHTIGHALEKLSHYKMLHGYAVGYGILVEAKISQLLGLLTEQNYLTIATILQKLTISAIDLKKFSSQQIIQQTKLDKKSNATQINYVLLKNLGEIYIKKTAYIHPVAEKIVQQALQSLRHNI